MTDARTTATPIRRDQQRALHAYNAVSEVPPEQRDDYQGAVNDLGANILRSGLCAAIAAVQRIDKQGTLLAHLASANVPGLEGATAQNFARQVYELDSDHYMHATRELLQVASWLKRAAQATFGKG